MLLMSKFQELAEMYGEEFRNQSLFIIHQETNQTIYQGAPKNIERGLLTKYDVVVISSKNKKTAFLVRETANN